MDGEGWDRGESDKGTDGDYWAGVESYFGVRNGGGGTGKDGTEREGTKDDRNENNETEEDRKEELETSRSRRRRRSKMGRKGIG